MSRALALAGRGNSLTNAMPVEVAAWTRGERTALGVALAVHIGLFALLSLRTGSPETPVLPKAQPIEVSLVKEVAPEATAPPAPEPRAPSVAPETGEPEKAAPAPAPAPRPEPVKQAAPEPAPAKPAPVKPAPQSVARPAPAPKPAAVKPAPAKLVPAAKPQAAAAKPAAAKPAPAKPTNRLAGLSASIAASASPAATATRPRGNRLGADFLAGLSADAPDRKASAAAPGTKPGPYPTASIVGAIARQIQPCADRQVNPGPGANEISTVLNIRLNKDGTLAATPTKVRQSGVNDENGRYAQRVVDLGIAAFKGCSPLRLPGEYYQTASGGWNVINYTWKLK